MTNIKPLIQFDDYGSFEIVQGTVSHTFPVHIHNSVCFGTITDGIAEFYCGGRKLLSKGDSFFIPRGTPHTLAAVSGQPYSYRTVCIKQSGSPFSSDEFLSRAYSYMLAEADTPFTIKALSGYMGCSESCLLHYFSRKCTLSPYQLYLNIRTGKIRQGLISGEPLLDLVHRYGFSHQSHLCNTFRKHAGLSPGQYRKSYHLHASAGENTASI